MEIDEERLQAMLEQLEAGMPLNQVLDGLSPEEAEIVRVAAQIRGIPIPARVEKLVRAQRSQVVQFAQQNKSGKESFMNSKRNWLKWLLPAVAFLFICSVTMVVLSGLTNSASS